MRYGLRKDSPFCLDARRLGAAVINRFGLRATGAAV